MPNKLKKRFSPSPFICLRNSDRRASFRKGTSAYSPQHIGTKCGRQGGPKQVCLLEIPLCTIVSGRPGKNLCPKCLLFLELSTFPLKSKTPAPSLYCRMAYKPQLPNASWGPISLGNPHMHICNKNWSFSPVNLSHVNLIIRPARRTSKG